MIPPITKLLIKIEQLEWDLAEVKKELEALQAPLMKSLTPGRVPNCTLGPRKGTEQETVPVK